MIYLRILAIVLGAWSLFMIWGGGFFWTELLPGNVIKTNTYTLYSRLPPPPRGPRFCSQVLSAPYGIVMPCDFEPVFVWWLLSGRGS